MDLFNETIDWSEEFKPLIAKYKNRKHPLDYNNIYQLMVMVILSAQDSDANINKIAPEFFDKFPKLKSIANSTNEDLIPYLTRVKNYPTKASWILEIAKTLKQDEKIPTSMKDLIALKGIGRKSANVIMREAEVEAEGIMVDLHVLRVVDRLGITHAKTGDKMEKDLMAVIPKKMWNELGMAISFLGRETCSPTNPKHNECVMKNICEYCKKNS